MAKKLFEVKAELETKFSGTAYSATARLVQPEYFGLSREVTESTVWEITWTDNDGKVIEVGEIARLANGVTYAGNKG